MFVVGWYRMNWFTTVTDGWMTVIDVEENHVHEVPVKVTRWNEAGRVNGLPQKHLVTGNPCWSRSTAVPDCRTAATVVALPLANPWLVTSVSVRSTAGVSPATNVGMSAGVMPSTPAQAAALSEFCWRKVTMAAESQLDWSAVPPYRPAVSPARFPAALAGGVTALLSEPAGGANGLAPA
jgi:hypothetical protein